MLLIVADIFHVVRGGEEEGGGWPGWRVGGGGGCQS